MKVRVYTDYDPIRIMQSFDPLKADIVAKKAGLTGAFVEIEDSELPKTREHRNEWKVNGKKVEPDQVKVQAKLDKIATKEAKKNSVLSKLKIAKEEFFDLLKE